MGSDDPNRFALVQFEVFLPSNSISNTRIWRDTFATLKRNELTVKFSQRYRGSVFKYDLFQGQMNEVGEEDKFVVADGMCTRHGDDRSFEDASVTIFSREPGSDKILLSSRQLDNHQYVRAIKPDYSKGSSHRPLLTFKSADGSVGHQARLFLRENGDWQTSDLSPLDPRLIGYRAETSGDRHSHWASMAFLRGAGDSTSCMFIPLRPDTSLPANSVAPGAS